jgi:hypothetical protein
MGFFIDFIRFLLFCFNNFQQTIKAHSLAEKWHERHLFQSKLFSIWSKARAAIEFCPIKDTKAISSRTKQKINR